MCLFGGTFDPIHIAHLRIANEALKTFALTRVVFIPGANPPHKTISAVTPYEDRFRMVEIACAPYPSFIASRLEAGAEPSYTIDTIERVRKELGPEDRLFFLIGGDAFNEIKTWKRWQDVIGLIEFIVVARPGREYEIPEGACVHGLDGIDLPVSSSSIRDRLAAGESVPEVPVEVREYIEQRGLYNFGRRPITVSP
ncbi:MAG: nicotinate (nicotinamide) nucleotide adenylyltransferase [Acidobacteriaceae bacterium]|nr:nicotinate (nicotinamide) nucleotide adenylyltransferase [Acidobacteriaceae bacterium]